MIKKRKKELNNMLKGFTFREYEATIFANVFNYTIREYGCISIFDLFDKNWPDAMFLLSEENERPIYGKEIKYTKIYNPEYIDGKLGWRKELRFNEIFKAKILGNGHCIYQLNLPKLEEL